MAQTNLKIVCTLRTYQISPCLNSFLSPSNHGTKAKDRNNLLRKTSVATSITKSIQEI